MALTGLILGYISLLFILIIAAIAIPNLLRARISANEAAAASTVRMLNTSQITYSTTYPEQGYARDLATLGRQLQQRQAPPNTPVCWTANWARPTAHPASGARKAQYKFTISSNCAPARFGEQQQGTDNACAEYVIAATPINSNTGRRNYCSVSDAIIRSRSAAPWLHHPQLKNARPGSRSDSTDKATFSFPDRSSSSILGK